MTPRGRSTRSTSFASRLRDSLALDLAAALRGTAGTATRRALRQIDAALHHDALPEALRIVDRVWRCEGEDAAALAPIYGRLLLLEAREYDAALGMLQHHLARTPDPEAAGMAALALLHLERPEDARRQLEAALGRYCVAPDDLLAYAAGEVAAHPAIGAPGWVGRGPDLGIFGEVQASVAGGSLGATTDTGLAFTCLLQGPASAKRRHFQFKIPGPGAGSVAVSIRGVLLLGSGQPVTPDFALDGRCVGEGRGIGGWARVGWAPGRPVNLRLEDSAGHCALIQARKPQPGAHWAFTQSLRALDSRAQRIEVSAELPDGRWQPLPDSPVLLEPAVRLTRARPPPLPRWEPTPATPGRILKRARQVDIVIPVYRGLEETLACIESVLATRDSATSVIVIDDATPEPALATALDDLAAKGRIVLLRNKKNLGFVASVNRGMALHEARDVVLLNSDTRVFGDWLTRLRRAAYSSPDAGTVTPLSNDGSIASYPKPIGTAMDVEAAAALDALAAATLGGVGADLPVGVGFCLYLRRDCLRDVGEFDTEVFGKGYGEESDFCLRARQRGWTHRLAADVFVYHASGASFGARRTALLDRARYLLNLRHPGYDRFIATFLKADPLQDLRRKLDERRLAGFPGGFVLLVTLALPGGVDRYVAERGRQLAQWGLRPLLLRPVGAGNPGRCELSTEALDVPSLQYDIPAQLDELTAVLRGIGLKGIEIQHFLGLDPRVIEAIRGLAVPYDVMVHDYAWICPRVTLIDGSGRYCGEPAVSVCRSCVRRHGSSLDEKISVPALRARSETWLRAARRVLAPSVDTAERLRRHFRDLPIAVQPHGRPYTAVPKLTGALRGRRLRVAVLGAIGEHKGYRVLLECARDARSRRLPLEFVVIGFTGNDAPLLATDRVFITGRYSESEVPHLLEREQPDLTWLPSVWPETWCYALDHLLRTGLPVVAFDIGALAERLRSVAGALMLPVNMSVCAINDRLLQVARERQIPEQLFSDFAR